jgi:hypothetical protein
LSARATFKLAWARAQRSAIPAVSLDEPISLNADEHPRMRRMHEPDPRLRLDQQDKGSVVPIELADMDTWLTGTADVFTAGS